MFKRATIFALLGVAALSARSYSVAIPESVQAGSTQLKAGDYTVKVNGNQVEFLDEHGNKLDLPATIQEGDRKFDHTAVDLSNDSGQNHIQWIELQGTKDKIVFQ
jgi:hypothetical protein